MLRAVILYLLLIVAIGQEGIAALSQITGLEIESGNYDFRADHVMIYAYGKSPVGLSWKVQVRWENGRPKYILFLDAKAEL